jgi:hypothetical protein
MLCALPLVAIASTVVFRNIGTVVVVSHVLIEAALDVGMGL